MSKSIRTLVIDWNNRWPIDYWWRKKYGIAFGSVQHLEMCFIDILFEYQEDALFLESIKKKDDEGEEDYLEITGEIVKSRSPEIKMSANELEIEFENLDPNDFNKK